MVHTSYDFVGGAIEGGIASGVDFTSRSYLNTSAAIIPYGRAIVYDSTDDGGQLPAGAGGNFIGVALKQNIYEDADTAGYPISAEFDVMSDGDVFVFTEQDVAPGDPVFFRHTANGAGKDQIGAFRKDTDSANADDISSVARWTSVTKAGEVAKLTIFGLG